MFVPHYFINPEASIVGARGGVPIFDVGGPGTAHPHQILASLKGLRKNLVTNILAAGSHDGKVHDILTERTVHTAVN